MNALNIKAFGLACGLVWAVGLLLLGISSMICGWGRPLVSLIGAVYIGYQSTVLGVLIGTIWALIDGIVYGALIAWIYNRFVRF